jgi:hypothetical protein
MTQHDLQQDLFKVIVPKSLSEFHLVSATEHSTYIELRLEDSADKVPMILSLHNKVVLAGFCNPIELQTFLLKGKPTFFKIYRHRWKLPGSHQHHSHTYHLHPEGIKATYEFAAFLKEMIDNNPKKISILAKFQQIDYKKLWRWYRILLSTE